VRSHPFQAKRPSAQSLTSAATFMDRVIGAVLFQERFCRWRISATVLVATGVILINL